MKVNVDAAISKNLGRASMAVVARDQVGMFFGASGVVLKVLLMLGYCMPERFTAPPV